MILFSFLHREKLVKPIEMFFSLVILLFRSIAKNINPINLFSQLYQSGLLEKSDYLSPRIQLTST